MPSMRPSRGRLGITALCCAWIVLFVATARSQTISTTGLLDHFNPNLGVSTDVNNNVVGWTNQAAAGRSVTAGNTTTTVVAGPNGSMLRFNAASGSGQLVYASAGSAVYSDGYTVFAVVRINLDASEWNSFPRLWRGANDNDGLYFRQSTATVEYKTGTSTPRPLSSYQAAYGLGDIAILGARISASSRDLYFNGRLVSSATGEATITVDNSTLQIGNSVKGDIGDVLVYNNSATLAVFNQTGIALAEAYGQPWTVSGPHPLDGPVTVPLTVATGTLNVSGAGSLAGTLQLGEAAGLQFTNGALLGAGSIRIAADALRRDGLDTGESSPPTVFEHTGTSHTSVANPIELPAPATAQTYTFRNARDTTLDFAGVISGGGPNTRLILNVPTSGNNTATFRLSAANTFQVEQVRLWRGAIAVGHLEGLGDPANQVSLGAPGVNSSTPAGTPNSPDGALRFEVGGTFANPIEVRRNNGISTGAHDVTLSGLISGADAATNDGSNLIKLGTGTLTLTAANTYVGQTWVNAGTLVAGHAAAFGTTGTVNVTANGTLGVADGVALSRPVSIAAGGRVRLGNGSSVALPNAVALAAVGSASPFEAATNAAILYGAGGSVPTVATAWTANDGSYFSDILSLEGTGANNLFVLSMSYAGSPASLADLNIFYRETATDAFAPLGSNFRGFAAWSAADHLEPGMYGIDTTSQTVWAVTDHNSQFVVAVPEPAAGLLVALGLVLGKAAVIRPRPKVRAWP